MAEFLQFLAVTILLKFIKCSQCVLIKSIISLDKVWRTKSNVRDVDQVQVCSLVVLVLFLIVTLDHSRFA